MEQSQSKKPLEFRSVLLFLCGVLIGVLLMIFLPNPMRDRPGNTADNIRRAAVGEGFGASRCLVYAQQAAAEQPEFAPLLRAVSQGEQTRAGLFLAASDLPDTLEEQLRALIRRENRNHLELYPAFRAAAQQEKNESAMELFRMAEESEALTAQVLTQALEALQSGEALTGWHLCPGCGGLYGAEVPLQCSICGKENGSFISFS